MERSCFLDAVDELVLLTVHKGESEWLAEGGLNISASGDHDEVFNMTHMACPYEAPTSQFRCPLRLRGQHVFSLFASMTMI